MISPAAAALSLLEGERGVSFIKILVTTSLLEKEVVAPPLYED